MATALIRQLEDTKTHADKFAASVALYNEVAKDPKKLAALDKELLAAKDIVSQAEKIRAEKIAAEKIQNQNEIRIAKLEAGEADWSKRMDALKSQEAVSRQRENTDALATQEIEKKLKQVKVDEDRIAKLLANAEETKKAADKALAVAKQAKIDSDAIREIYQGKIKKLAELEK